jgi:hypothetical protein
LSIINQLWSFQAESLMDIHLICQKNFLFTCKETFTLKSGSSIENFETKFIHINLMCIFHILRKDESRFIYFQDKFPVFIKSVEFFFLVFCSLAWFLKKIIYKQASQLSIHSCYNNCFNQTILPIEFIKRSIHWMKYSKWKNIWLREHDKTQRYLKLSVIQSSNKLKIIIKWIEIEK